MAESLAFDPSTGRLFMCAPDAPSLDEIMKDPNRYPNYVVVTDLETGKMEVLTKAEANRRTDIVVLKKMAASGFFSLFQQLWSTHTFLQNGCMTMSELDFQLLMKERI